MIPNSFFYLFDNNASVRSAGEDTEIDLSSTEATPILILKVMLVQCLLIN